MRAPRRKRRCWPPAPEGGGAPPKPQLTLEGPALGQSGAAGGGGAQSAEPPIPLPQYARQGYQQRQQARYGPQNPPPPVQHRGLSSRTILIILLAVVLMPLWLGLAGALLGVIGAVLGTGFGLFFGGVGAVVGTVAVMAANVPAAFAAGWPVGLFMVGLCLLAIAVGVALICAGVWFFAWLLPTLFRLVKKGWNALFCKEVH